MIQNKAYATIQAHGSDTGAPLNLRKRLSLIQRHVSLSDKRCIDCGCGTGDYVVALHRLGVDIWGLEYSVEKVMTRKSLNPEFDRLLVGDIQQTAFCDQSFDIALLNEVLEHVPDDKQGLAEVYRLLRYGGILILFSPNRLYPFETHGVYRKDSMKSIPHYIPFIPYIPLAIGQKFFRYWARNYWSHELVGFVEKAGFSVLHTDYIWQTFENISGHQPFLVRLAKPSLRALSSWLERLPVIRAFGVSQVIIAQKNMTEPNPARGE